MNLCRASFATASIIANPKDYPYGGKATPLLSHLISDADQKKIDETILHDAVMNTAMVWKHVWEHAMTRTDPNAQ